MPRKISKRVLNVRVLDHKSPSVITAGRVRRPRVIVPRLASGTMRRGGAIGAILGTLASAVLPSIIGGITDSVSKSKKRSSRKSRPPPPPPPEDDDEDY